MTLQTPSSTRRVRSVPALAAIAAATLILAIGLAPSLLAQQATAIAVIEKPLIDLGKLTLGTEGVAVFTIENQGTAPLELSGFKTPCGCTEESYPETIAPGEKGTVTVKIDTTMLPGSMKITGQMETNDPDNPMLLLTAKFFGDELLAAFPGKVRYTVYEKFDGDSSIKQIVFAGDAKNFNILRVESPYDYLTVSEPRAATAEERLSKYPGSQWAFEITLANDAPVGVLRGAVLVHTDHPMQKLLPVLVSGFVRPAMVFTPDKFTFSQFAVPDSGTYLEVHAKQFTEEEVAITKLECDIEGFEVSFRERTKGRVWKIRATATKELPLGPFNGTVLVHTDHEKFKTLSIPLRGNHRPRKKTGE